jgi:tetratricopeptide (TPR) repeat protein
MKAASSNAAQAKREAFLALLFQERGEWTEAKSHWSQALTLYQAQDDDHGVAQALSNLGNICQKLGQIDEEAPDYIALRRGKPATYEEVRDTLELVEN